MNERIKKTLISKLDRIEDAKREELSFTVTECRGHKSRLDLLIVTMQTENGKTVRESFFIKSPGRLISLLKSCGVYRPDMTAGGVLQDLPGKTGRAVFLTDPDGETHFSHPITPDE